MLKLRYTSSVDEGFRVLIMFSFCGLGISENFI